MSIGIPRRIRIDQMVPAELAIRNAMLSVEGLGADTRLTEAVVLLGEAQAKVADFVDGVTPSEASFMLEDQVRLEALHLQIRTGYRYLECLWCVVWNWNSYFADNLAIEPEWFDEFFRVVVRDWIQYRKAMIKAGQGFFDLRYSNPDKLQPLRGLAAK